MASLMMLGPALNDPGGMASVQRDLLWLLEDVLDVEANHVATYSSGSRLGTLRRFLAAVAVAGAVRAGIHHRRSVAHLHVSQRGSFVRALIITAILAGTSRLVITVHGSRFRPWSRRHPRLAGRVLSRADVVTVLSSETLATVRELTPGTDVRVVPNFVRLIEAGPVPLDSRRVVAAGEVSRRKGFDLLFDTWLTLVSEPEYADCRLVVAGPLADAPIPQHSSIEYVGAVSRTRVLELLVTSRVGVLASRAEAMPMFVLEVMAAGRPVITTRIEGLEEVVGSGGLTVPPGDPTALGSALRQLLGDGNLARKLGEAAKEQIRRTYSPDVLADQWAAIYGFTVDRTRNRPPN